MSHCLLLPPSHFSTLLCCPLTFIGTVHPVSQIQQGDVFQQSSNKFKKKNRLFPPGCDCAQAEKNIIMLMYNAMVLPIDMATGREEDVKF